MKKFLILSLSLTMFCPYAAAETIYLYKQTTTATTADNTANTVQSSETSVSVEQNGGSVYKVKTKSKAGNGYTENVDYSTTNSNIELEEGEVILRNEKLNSNPFFDDGTQSKSKKSKQKIKNTAGKNQDYITAPSNSGDEYKNTIRKIVSRINDPYVIKINGVKYYLVKNATDGNYTLNNILGYGDSKTSLFTSLSSLDTNSDLKITKEELQKANVRFVEVGGNGKLQLNDTSKDFTDIVYIDLGNIRESINTANMIGSFGYFDVYIKDKNGNKKKIIGYVSFDSDNELLEMIK